MSEKRQKRARPTVVLQATSVDGSKKAVGIKNLRVVISLHEGMWFAQGMEIDYAAQGESFARVKKAFERGLEATIGEHLKIFGNLGRLLQPAHEDAWKEFYQAQSCHEYSQLSIHASSQTGFGQIEYLKAA